MAIIKSTRDQQLRQSTGIDTNLNAQQFHELVESRKGTTSQVSTLKKKYQLGVAPKILNTNVWKHT